ncbi:unnamed protein product [Allacma fusca]|uniref:PDZ domain-containing protein 8 n=1 Tax=Allacma fusca TaxID=39272 RepID=A0A8J2LE58_9HEXA|nr:unnamed protein product [Allacma fusca]
MLTYLAIFLLGMVAGVSLVVAGVWYILSFFFHDPDMKNKDDVKSQHYNSSTFQLPPVLLSKINDESCKSKESCWALNFVLYFLFRELRNSEPIRRWILRKLSMEFEELLASSVLGKFFSSISIQNLDVGQNFPVVNWLKTSKVELHPIFKSISTLDILVDIDYSGGFQFAIQAETHLKHSAFLSVQFNEVKGHARLQFATEPYAHWSFSFAENPSIDISVVSQLYGKSFNQITSIIASQLKRSVRKKHTLPMFKIRYKPFFSRVEQILATLVPDGAPRADSRGSLSVTMIECRGLMSSLLHGNIFAHLAVGDFNWVAAYPESPHVYLVLDVVCVKTAKRETNLDFTLMLQNNIPTVESVSSGASCHDTSQGALRLMELEVGDEIIAVDGKRVTTIKQCVKNFRNSPSMKVLWRIRRRYLMTEGNDSKNTVDESVTAKAPKLETDTDVENFSQSRRSSDEASESENSSAEKRSIFSFRVPKISACNDIVHIFRTSDFPSTKDPIFMESFCLNVEESSRYVNLTLWSSVGPKGHSGSNSSSPTSSPAKKNNKQKETDDFGRDRVIGILTVPISDIISECSTTGMGYFIKDFYLGSPDGNASAAREHNLKDHSGFEPHMCYGKISMSFMYKSGEDTSKKNDSLDSLSSSSVISPVETAVEASPESAKVSPSEEPQSHQFVRTHFRSATVCDYCNKKIWLKEAYTCRVCDMKCHKKCHERCVANTVCRGYSSQYHAGHLQISNSNNPEIITTDIEPHAGENDDDDDSHDRGSILDTNLAANSNSVRRRTLGGLIVSAVQHRSAQLRRAGSATTLLPPTLNPNSVSRSLPQSPQASPTTSRKASVTSASSGNVCGNNPFETLDAGGLGISEDDLNAAVEHLIQHSNDDDLVALAKETGRDVFSELPLADRKQKLNHVWYYGLNRLQEEIDIISNERLALTKEEASASPSAKSSISYQAVKCEERVQALALLMLHFCAGLQHVQDLEEQQRECRDKQQQRESQDSQQQPESRDHHHVYKEDCQNQSEHLKESRETHFQLGDPRDFPDDEGEHSNTKEQIQPCVQSP